MKIPLSSIEPFGVGIPIVGTSAISDELDRLFNDVTGTTTIDDVAIDVNIFCQLAGMKIIHMGGKNGTINLSGEMRGTENKLLAVTITIVYEQAAGVRRTKVYTVNPVGLFYIKRDSCNPFHN